MKKVDVLTAHNVTINYDLASVIMRVIASLVDLICILLYAFIFSAILGVSAVSYGDLESMRVVYYLLIAPVFFCYSPLCEMAFKGQSLGKRIVGIRVIQVNGEKAKLEQVLMRWVFRIVDLWLSFGSIAMLSSSASSKAQRIGDRLAQTVVVRTTPQTVYALKDVQRIHSNENYSPTYSNVVEFCDEDMMLIKKALGRMEKSPNEYHKQLCLDLADRSAERLNLLKTPDKKRAFLQTLLKDYIVLTR